MTPLLSTENMVTYLVGGNAPLGVRRRVGRMIYNLAREGKIKNYGGPLQGRALWNPVEVLAEDGPFVVPYEQCASARP